jgi:hypothetical protein
LRLETAVSESRPNVQDDIQAINKQQQEEIWIDRGMKEHLVTHWDGLGDEEEDIEYKEINVFTLLIKRKEKDHSSMIKYHQDPKLSRSNQERERKKQNKLAIVAAGSHPLFKGFLISAHTAESTHRGEKYSAKKFKDKVYKGHR